MTPTRTVRGVFGCLLLSLLNACSLVTTPIKVAGSVVEHTIDAVSPFDDAPKSVQDQGQEGKGEALRSRCPSCGVEWRS